MFQKEVSSGFAYRPDIDGLRAVAVLAVVFYHAQFPGFSGGFVGVDVFFVISGFLIGGIVWRELQHGSFSLTGFYLRRIKRIFPALFAVLAVSSVLAFFLLIPSDLESFGRRAKAAVLFFSNFDFINIRYFEGPSIEHPVLHTWSLSVEEQFYLVWPVTLLVIFSYLPRRAVLPAILVLAAFSLVMAEYKMQHGHQREAFFLPHYRAWELLTGAALAIAPFTVRRGVVAEALAACGLAAILFAVAGYTSKTPFPGLYALLPCAGAALIIAAGQGPAFVTRLLSFAPLRFVGLISYSLYLIHWPLFSFAKIYTNGELETPYRVAIVLASLLLAYLSWRFVETPARRAQLPPKRVFVRAGYAMGALCCVGAVFEASHGLPFRVDGRIKAAEKLKEWDYSTYCPRIKIPEVHDGTTCELGDLSRNGYDFMLWGDSHAEHYVPAIDTLAKSRGLHGVSFTTPACPPFAGNTLYYDGCRRLNAGVLSWLQKQRLRFALLGARWVIYDRERNRDMQRGTGVEGANGLEATLTQLEKAGAPAVLHDDVPEFNRNIRQCMAREMMRGRNYDWCLQQPQSIFEERHKPVETYFNFLRRRHHFAVASPVSALCGGGVCSASINGEIMIRDHDHLTPAGALYVMRFLDIPGLSDGVGKIGSNAALSGPQSSPQSGSAAAPAMAD